MCAVTSEVVEVREKPRRRCRVGQDGPIPSRGRDSFAAEGPDGMRLKWGPQPPNRLDESAVAAVAVANAVAADVGSA